MISVVLCEVSQQSRQKPKSYDGKFVTAKYSCINYGATLRYDSSVKDAALHTSLLHQFGTPSSPHHSLRPVKHAHVHI